MDMDLSPAAGVRSREALRFEYVDEQGWDASCGYAALASLLRRYRERPVTEESLLERSAGPGGGAGVVKVTLAELVRLVREAGLEARAWRATYGGLGALVARTPVPVLVHYDRPQGHFALLLRAGEGGLVTADPARGLELLTRDQFLARWSGVVLEVLDPRSPGLGKDLVEKAVRSVLGRAWAVDEVLSNPPPKRYFEPP